MARSCRLLLLMFFYAVPWFSTADSVDCAESVQGPLTLLSQQEEDAETVVVSTVKLPFTTLHATGQSFAGDNLTVNFVSELQHLRTVTNSEWRAGLLDGSVIVVFKNSTVVHLALDAEDCVPYQLFQHAPNSSAFVMCSNMSRILKMEITPAGFLLEGTALQAQKGQKPDQEYLNVPAVPLYHPDPDLQTSAAFIHFGLTSDGQDKTWLTVVHNIEMEVNNHDNIICDDTFDEGPREACYTRFTRILPFNETHFVLECRETSDSDAVRFLVDAFFKMDCEGIVVLNVHEGGKLYVGPDQDTLAVNLGDRVSVHTNNFTQSFYCIVPQGVDRVDFGTTADDGVLLFLSTSGGIFTCNRFGEVELLSSSALLNGPYPYFIDDHRIFVTQGGNSAGYSIGVFDAQEGCQVQHPNAGPIYTDKRPVLYQFFPEEANDPTTTPPPTQPSADEVTQTTVTPLSSLTTQSSPDASDNTLDILVPIVSVLAIVILILLAVSLIAIALWCNHSHKPLFRILRVSRVTTPSDSVSRSSAGSDPPIPETQDPLSVRNAIPATDDSPCSVRYLVPDSMQVLQTMKLPIPESGEASDTSLPVQAVGDKLRMPQTREQIV